MIENSVGPLDRAAGPSAVQQALYQEFSPINHVRAGRQHPPVYLLYSPGEETPCKRACIHHHVFGQKLLEQCEAVGAEAYLDIATKPDWSRRGPYSNELGA